MAIIPRQTGLLSAENWKKVYQTFREADFTAYDFETLRKTMIDYIKINYPEDFNDFTESSEFIALIDLIAFFGQSLAFRTDLNARENFIDTAERRDSILKLARLVSYNPKRTVSASGYLKIDSVSTSETVYDNSGIDLSNTIVNWADPGNENWYEQFTLIVNSCLLSSQVVGKPGRVAMINGIRTEEYSVNVTPDIIPVYRFTNSVDGRDTTFEAVSASFANKTYIYEAAPKSTNPYNILYFNDNQGNGSNNTGFFIYFKQGELASLDFTINEAVANKVVNVDVSNINNTDVWLYSVTDTGAVDQLWTQVPSTSGVNVIYNTSAERNLYQVNSKNNDQISLVFGDGAFTNIPRGNFRLFYRTSNGATYRITPDEMRGVQISFDYVSRYNRVETVTFRASLRYTVANASARESVDDIRQRAPQFFYTQNRMVTGEDYNSFPYTTYSTIAKVQAVNRTSSGLSRYLDILDTTGKYSSTNIFGQDGVLYQDEVIDKFSFNFDSVFDIRKIIFNSIIPDIIDNKEVVHNYYSKVAPETPPEEEISASQMVNDQYYKILFAGSTNFTQYNSDDNNIGTEFISANLEKRTYSYDVKFTTTDLGPSYTFTNVAITNNPTLTITSGDILTFNIDTPGQPFFIKTERTSGTGNLITTGSVNQNGITTGKITWNTNGVAPGEYYYVSQSTVAVGGRIVVSGFGTGRVKSELEWSLTTTGDSGCSGFFKYNSYPFLLNDFGQRKYLTVGAMVKFVAPANYYFNSSNNLVPGTPDDPDDSRVMYAAITNINGDGANNGAGNLANGSGPVTLSKKVPTGAQVDYIIPVFKNDLTDSVVQNLVELIGGYNNFGLKYDKTTMTWQVIPSDTIRNSNDWIVKFEFDLVGKQYYVSYKTLKYIFHSPGETNFYYDQSQNIYDNSINRVIRDNINILKVNSEPGKSGRPLGIDYQWAVLKPIVRENGYIDNKGIYLTFYDGNDDGVPDNPFMFEKIVTDPQRLTSTIVGENSVTYNDQVNNFYFTYTGEYPSQTSLDEYVSRLTFKINTLQEVENSIRYSREARLYAAGAKPKSRMVFFELTSSYDKYDQYTLIDNKSIITNLTYPEIVTMKRNFEVGQLFYVRTEDKFYQCYLDSSNIKNIKQIIDIEGASAKYRVFTGRQGLYFQYRHNSANTNRLDPNISNIIDVYVLLNSYNQDYRRYIQDTSRKVTEPTPPTTTELAEQFKDLENYKVISDSMIFHSAVFKPLFGTKAEVELQAIFKVVKNNNLNLTDADIKSSVIGAINRYFSVDNWDFGETFYFSELAAYLHKELSPAVASIIIVPKDATVDFGSMYQIGAEANEILISAATVDDVEIISSITSGQIVQNLSMTNRSIGI